LEDGLPDVLKSVVQRIQARANQDNNVIAQRALYHLYKIHKIARGNSASRTTAEPK
jgi:hypothetical protein